MDSLKVYQFDKKLRLGSISDGGYVIADLEGNYDCYISAGISDEESFSRDFLNKYNVLESHGFDGTISHYPTEYTDRVNFIKKNINFFNDDNNTDLSDLLDRFQNIFLKMDIEGGEYPWILCVHESRLKNIKQIVIEFHGVNGNNWGCNLDNKFSCFKKLERNFYVVHAHGNNYGKFINGIPDVLELTLVNKSYFSEPPELNKIRFPQEGLDFPNNPAREDFDLNRYPFVKIC
jgi:hypothetical protein